MNERDIFLAAIEIADPAERAAYLDQACADDAELRAQVEELLKTHSKISQFLETPAVATDSVVDRTVLTDASDTDEDSADERPSGEAEIRKYLEPATRPGWLGRLAHYEIEEILGRGAFGIVAKAFDEKLHRVVAIKLMSPELASISPPRKRFLREARAAAAVTHENIVAIHAVEEEPIPYLVMEYISGETLQQRMDGHGPLEVPDVLRIGQQVASGLAAAHAVNLIHRDIKPSNILLSDGPSSRLKISDFGLARAVDDASITKSGMIPGTPMYMAPEQVRNETLDHRADLFSLGSVLYQMAGGRPPFRAANTLAVLMRVCEDTPRTLHDVLPGTPGWLEAIIFKLLEKDRDDRYQTAQEVADLMASCQRELEDNSKVTCVEGRSGTAETRVSQAKKSTDTGTHKKPLGWLVGGVIAVAAVIGLVLMNGGKKTPDPDLTSSTSNTTSDSTNETPINRRETIWHADSPPPAVAPFNATQAKAHQEAWASYLQTPAEQTNSIGMKLKLIPSGSFTMGDDNGESDEKPVHQVTLSQPFMLGVHEVTQAQYEQVMGSNPSSFKGPQNPVEKVSWEDAMDFCRKLSALPGERSAGRVYRLPTEAEWEYACRAGTTTKYGFGDDASDLGEYAWYDKNSGRQTHPVGQKQPNAWGLYDMHGNVFEWCADQHGGYPSGSVTDPSGPQSGSVGVGRGGGWYNTAELCRSASRDRFDPSYRYDGFIGFRVTCVPSRQGPQLAGKTNDVTSMKDPGSPVESASLVDTEDNPVSSRSGSLFNPSGQAPTAAVAPFTAEQAKAHQEAWASYLQTPVEQTNSIGMKLKLIPAGTFTMGNRSNGYNYPIHQVTLSKPFMLGMHEVTQEQYERLMFSNPSFVSEKGPQNPVLASWDDAMEFCRKLSALPEEHAAGRVYRLPTEAQWEYACRAGTTTEYVSGDDESDLGQYAWHVGNSEGKLSHSVGQKQPNAWGLYDMHGNVWEWCADWFDRYPSGSVTDPTGPQSGSHRVQRGGTARDYSVFCKSAYRSRVSVRSYSGFRVICVPSGQ